MERSAVRPYAEREPKPPLMWKPRRLNRSMMQLEIDELINRQSIKRTIAVFVIESIFGDLRSTTSPTSGVGSVPGRVEVVDDCLPIGRGGTTPFARCASRLHRIL